MNDFLLKLSIYCLSLFGIHLSLFGLQTKDQTSVHSIERKPAKPKTFTESIAQIHNILLLVFLIAFHDNVSNDFSFPSAIFSTCSQRNN